MTASRIEPCESLERRMEGCVLEVWESMVV